MSLIPLLPSFLLCLDKGWSVKIHCWDWESCWGYRLTIYTTFVMMMLVMEISSGKEKDWTVPEGSFWWCSFYHLLFRLHHWRFIWVSAGYSSNTLNKVISKPLKISVCWQHSKKFCVWLIVFYIEQILNIMLLSLVTKHFLIA